MAGEGNLRSYSIPTRLADGTDPTKVAAVVGSEPAHDSTALGLIVRQPGVISKINSLLASLATSITALDTINTTLSGNLNTKSPGATSVSGTIASSQSLSGTINLGIGATLSGLLMPTAWTSAPLSFQVSLDGTNFFNKYDSFGSEYSIPSASSAANQFIQIPLSEFAGIRYIKIRSGLSGAAVTQSVTSVFSLVAIL